MLDTHSLTSRVAIGLTVQQQVGDNNGDDDAQDSREHLKPQVGLRKQPEHHGHAHSHKAKGNRDIGITELELHVSIA